MYRDSLVTNRHLITSMLLVGYFATMFMPSVKNMDKTMTGYECLLWSFLLPLTSIYSGEVWIIDSAAGGPAIFGRVPEAHEALPSAFTQF